MTELSALELLLGTQPGVEITDTVTLKRLGKFTIKALTGDDLSKIREQATYPSGTGKSRKLVVNEDEVGQLLVAKATVEPDFSDAALLKHYGAANASNCVQKALLAGGIATIQQAVLELSGFNDADEVEEVKN